MGRFLVVTFHFLRYFSDFTLSANTKRKKEGKKKEKRKKRRKKKKKKERRFFEDFERKSD